MQPHNKQPRVAADYVLFLGVATSADVAREHGWTIDYARTQLRRALKKGWVRDTGQRLKVGRHYFRMYASPKSTS